MSRCRVSPSRLLFRFVPFRFFRRAIRTAPDDQPWPPCTRRISTRRRWTTTRQRARRPWSRSRPDEPDQRQSLSDSTDRRCPSESPAGRRRTRARRPRSHSERAGWRTCCCDGWGPYARRDRGKEEGRGGKGDGRDSRRAPQQPRPPPPRRARAPVRATRLLLLLTMRRRRLSPRSDSETLETAATSTRSYRYATRAARLAHHPHRCAAESSCGVPPST